MSWKIVNNTDNVDIDAKCIGLSPRRDTIPQDVWDHIATNRGLHVQIRHNKDPQAFGQANELARLIATAPDLLQGLKDAEEALTIMTGHVPPKDTELQAYLKVNIRYLRATINKAEGKE